MEDPPRDKEVTDYMSAAPSAASVVNDNGGGGGGAARRRTEHLAFPLMGKVQEIELGGLSKGWYLVCGEAVRTDDNVVLERDCLWARIFEVQEEGRGSNGFGECNAAVLAPKICLNSKQTLSVMHVGIIVLMAVASAAVIVGVACAIYARIKRERRKRIDK